MFATVQGFVAEISNVRKPLVPVELIRSSRHNENRVTNAADQRPSEY